MGLIDYKFYLFLGQTVNYKKSTDLQLNLGDTLRVPVSGSMCLNASFVQWCHCWCNPHQTRVNTHPPSSLCASTGQLSLLLLSADGLREGWGGAGRGGWVDSWADAKAPPGFAEDRPFPSHPAAVQLPRHQLSAAIAPNGLVTSLPRRLVENPVEMVLYSCTVQDQMTFYKHPPTPVITPDYPRQNTPGNALFPFWPLTTALHTMSPMITQHVHNGGNTFTFIWGQITVQIHIKGLCILQTGLFCVSKAQDVQPVQGSP